MPAQNGLHALPHRPDFGMALGIAPPLWFACVRKDWMAACGVGAPVTESSCKKKQVSRGSPIGVGSSARSCTIR